MKLIIFGTRDAVISPWDVIREAELLKPDEIVHGYSGNVDLCAEVAAWYLGVPFRRFPYIKEMGKRGGPARNRQMGAYGDEGLGFWDRRSDGTRDMLNHLRSLGKPCVIRPVVSARAMRSAPAARRSPSAGQDGTRSS